MKGILHGYTLGKVIHTGTDVVLYQSVAADGKALVIKTPLSRIPAEETIAALRFEAEALCTLRHDNIIRYVGFREDNPVILVMEQFDAPTLEALRNEDPDAVREKMREILIQTCDAVGHVHENGYIHRDIKPGNILVDRQANVRLIDFSIARKMRKGWFSRRPKEKKIEGTRSYVAPEILAMKSYDQRADIYSLGIMCYVLLAGRLPFTGTSTRELTMKHLSHHPSPLTVHEKSISRKMNDLVLWMMAKSPEDRPQSVLEIRDRLMKISFFE